MLLVKKLYLYNINICTNIYIKILNGENNIMNEIISNNQKKESEKSPVIAPSSVAIQPIPNQSYIPLAKSTFDKFSNRVYSFKIRCCESAKEINCPPIMINLSSKIAEKYISTTVDQSSKSIDAVPGQGRVPLVILTTDESRMVYVFRIVKESKNVVIEIPKDELKECNSEEKSTRNVSTLSDTQAKCIRDCRNKNSDVPQTLECVQIPNLEGCFSNVEKTCIEESKCLTQISENVMNNAKCNIILGYQRCFSDAELVCIKNCQNQHHQDDKVARDSCVAAWIVKLN